MNHRLRLSGLLLAVVLVGAAYFGTGAGDEAPAGDPIPLTPYTTSTGEQTSPTAYVGSPIVVNFWASWYPSCVNEMSAAFLAAQQQLGDDVACLRTNIQDERDRALDLITGTGVLFDLAEEQR